VNTKKTAENYIQNAEYWQVELRSLRKVLLSTELEETIKWGMPYYTWSGKNIVGMSGFKSYFGLWFTQGVFLKDRAGVLINAVVPPELTLEMTNNASLKSSFENLSQSQKREYSEHINSAKREETKARRLTKIIPMILSGAGLNDKYRK